MARLPRLCLPGQAHWLIQRGHNGQSVFADETDRALYGGALLDASRQEGVQVHAYALCESEAHLLLTPARQDALGRLMQAVGRRFVSAHHRRHGGAGTLWDGRFRSAAVEPGDTLLDVLCLIDGLGSVPGSSSLAHRVGGRQDPMLTDLQEYWQLGNTPFERQSLWRQRVSEGLPQARVLALRSAAWGGWVVGSAAFAQRIGEASARPAAPRPRGRPRSV